MARRYGGKFSPDSHDHTQDVPRVTPAMGGRVPDPGVMRPNLLFIAALPLLVTAFFQGAVGMAVDLGAFALLALAAWLTRDGLRAHAAYDARRIARRPAIPRKLFGSALTGAGVALAAYDGSLLATAILGVLGLVLHVAAFGTDPLTDKGMEGIDRFQTERVARAVGEAEKHLAAMSDAILRAKDRALEARVEHFQSTARDMFRRVEEDPRDLTAARRYMGVYLMGAKDATVKFADIYARKRDPQVRADYEALLDDLEAGIAAKTDKLLEDNRTDLDVEIEVLRERLQREGVRAE
ncbi:MAG: 5-bromo-4-chloroindolyl phosphate hydrolysis family protein [Brevirhabdus sp.]